MGNGHGGARPGAGRPRKTEKYVAQIAATEDRIADALPQFVKNQIGLANGGWWEEEVDLAPAGTVTRGGGEWMELVYPDKPADELVVVKKRRRRVAPDRRANEYLIDRILGKPTAQIEAEVSGPNGEAILVRFGEQVTKIYGDEPCGGD